VLAQPLLLLLLLLLFVMVSPATLDAQCGLLALQVVPGGNHLRQH
jgi:hypothetical protein